MVSIVLHSAGQPETIVHGPQTAMARPAPHLARDPRTQKPHAGPVSPTEGPLDVQYAPRGENKEESRNDTEAEEPKRQSSEVFPASLLSWRQGESDGEPGGAGTFPVCMGA